MSFSPRFSDALVYAAALHAEQRRKVSGEPYLAHLLGVTSIVMENGGTEDECIAALLHDAVEDQGGQATLDEIGRRFGPTVAEIVAACSDAFTAKTEKKRPWRERKEEHIARLRNATDSVRLVVAADKLHNIRSLIREYHRRGDAVWSFFHGGRDGSLWYYRTVSDVLWQKGRTPLLEELDGLVSELSQ